MDVKAISKKVATEFSKNLPTIATFTGVAGLITTIGLTIKIAPKAQRIYDAKRAENKSLTLWEKVKILAPLYWPVVLSGGLTAGCFIFSNHVNLKRNAAAIAAYQVSEAALNSFKDAAAKTVGEKKAKEIEYEADEQRIRLDPVSKAHIIETGHGNTLCYDSLSGRYFHCNMEWIRRAQNTINGRLINEIAISLNEFYDEIGLPQIDLGDMLGWNLHGKDDQLDVSFTSHVTDEGEPALVIRYNVVPTYDFYDLT